MGGVSAMGKRRNKRQHQAKELNQLTIDVGTHAHVEGSDPPILGEQEVPVPTQLKPKPHIRSGTIALPEPEPDEC